jgi:hypothetical protein
VILDLVVGGAGLVVPIGRLAFPGVVCLGLLALGSEIIICKENRVSNPYGVVINVIVLTHARLRQAWAMYSNRCRGMSMNSNRCCGMSLIYEYRFLITKPLVFEANREIGGPGGGMSRGVGALFGNYFWQGL